MQGAVTIYYYKNFPSRNRGCSVIVAPELKSYNSLYYSVVNHFERLSFIFK